MHLFRQFRRVLSRQQYRLSLSTYPLPWPRLQKVVPSEPPWNKAAGFHLLDRVLRRVTGAEFKTNDFLDGAEESIGSYIHLLKHRNTEVLQDIMDSKLYDNIFQSLSTIPSTSQILIDVESIRHIKLTGINSVIGLADPDDMHTISWLGQTVVTSQKKLEDVMDVQKNSFSFQHAREIGKEATMMNMEFTMTVTFNTKEKYAILDDTGALIEGSNKFINGHHIWKYGSSVVWDNYDYPFEWKLYDINNYLRDIQKSE